MGVFDKLGGSALAVLRGWALRSEEDVPFSEMRKALAEGGLIETTEEKPRALFHDPYSVMDWGGWRQRPSALTYDTLRQMTVSNSVIAAIIQTRVNQVAQFARPQQGPYDKGFKIVLRDRRDKNRSMTKAEQKKATEIERMLETTGALLPDEKAFDRDSFRTYLKKSTRDVLTYDQWCTELLRDRRSKLSRFIALPSESIRPAVSDVEHMDPVERHNRVAYVQIYEETIIAEFGPDDLAWAIMNPRSDLRVNGFGFSPVEQIVRLVTAWLYGFEYNSKFFTQGSAIKGILNVKGAIPDRQLRAFRRMWYSMISGVHNAWKTPILNSEDIQWVNMHSANREMEYAAWMDWLTKLICAVFGVDPVEINFVFGGQGTGQSSMFDRRPNQAEVVESKDKGLRPLIDHLTDTLNTYIVWDLEPDFEFAFAGLDAKAEEKEREARLQEIKAYKTLDQVRAEMNDPPLPNGLGEVVLDPTWLQWAMNKQQQGPQEAPPDQDEQLLTPGEEGGGEEEGGEEGEEPSPEEAEEEGAKSQEEALAASESVVRLADELRKSLGG